MEACRANVEIRVRASVCVEPKLRLFLRFSVRQRKFLCVLSSSYPPVHLPSFLWRKHFSKYSDGFRGNVTYRLASVSANSGSIIDQTVIVHFFFENMGIWISNMELDFKFPAFVRVPKVEVSDVQREPASPWPRPCGVRDKSMAASGSPTGRRANRFKIIATASNTQHIHYTHHIIKILDTTN